MSDRLNELANSASALRSTLTVCGQSKPQLDENLRDISALLRAASAETVGTEWYPTGDACKRHNADVNAARVAIAAAKAERDDMAGRWHIARTLCDAKQRAIDEALAAWDDWYQRDGVIDKVEAALRPHATKATEAKPSATVTGSGLCCTDCDPVFRKAYGLDEVAPATTPNSVAREIASVESGDIRYRVWECRVIVPADAPLPDGFDAPPRRAVIDAITSRGIDILRCASGWGHTPTDDELGVLDKEIHYPSQPATPATTPTAAGATPAADDDTRDLIARLALAVRNDAAERCNAELEAACDAIIAIARRGGGA